MIKVKLNNGKLLDINVDIVKNILPEELLENSSTILPLPMVDPDIFELFVEDYDVIINEEKSSMKYINIASVLQLYDMLNILEFNILKILINKDDDNLVKKEILNYCKDKISNGPLQEIARNIPYFELDYSVHYDNYLVINSDLTHIAISSAHPIFGMILHEKSEVSIYKNGLLQESFYDSIHDNIYYFNNDRLQSTSMSTLTMISKDGKSYIDQIIIIPGALLAGILHYNNDQKIIKLKKKVCISPNMNYWIEFNDWKTLDIYDVKNDKTLSVDILKINSNYSKSGHRMIEWSQNEKFILFRKSKWCEQLLYIIEVKTCKIISKYEGISNDIYIKDMKVSTINMGDTGLIIKTISNQIWHVPFMINGIYVDIDFKYRTLIYQQEYDNDSNIDIKIGLNDDIAVIEEDNIHVYRRIIKNSLDNIII